jgi:hypothetical protein
MNVKPDSSVYEHITPVFMNTVLQCLWTHFSSVYEHSTLVFMNTVLQCLWTQYDNFIRHSEHSQLKQICHSRGINVLKIV